MHPISGRWQLGLALTLCTALMWGLLPIALKGVLAQMDAITITWFRFTLSSVLIGLWLWLREGFPWGRLVQANNLRRFGIAILGLLGNFIWYLMGLDYTTASATQVMIQVAPMLMLVLSLWVFNERLSAGQFVGVLLFVLGLLLFFNLRLAELWQALLSGQGRYALGLLLVFVAALVWAIYGVIQKKLQRDFSSMQILWVIFTVGAISFAPWSDFGTFADLTPLAWYCLLFAGLNTIAAYGTFAYALLHWEASRVSATITLVPVFTLLGVQLVDWLAPHFLEIEPMNWLSWLGAGLVVMGSMAAALWKGRG